MTNRNQFIKEIEHYLSCENGIHLSEPARQYFEEIKYGKAILGGVTEMGEKILAYMHQNTSPSQKTFSAKIIGEGLFETPRAVSSAMNKLVNNQYVEKVGKNPMQYALTESGINYCHSQRESID